MAASVTLPTSGPRIAGKAAAAPGCCSRCGGAGEYLPADRVVCPDCRWLRPLVPGYQVDASAFAWAGDAKAMATLRSIKVLTAAAGAVSERVGRRWIEVTFNGIRLSEKQLPQIYAQAVRAARVLGMSHMPDLYLSGERPWDMLTFGTDRDSFIVIGSAIAANFQGPDMYFLLARQLGHCKAGHSLWKTVIRFLLGDQGPQKGMLAGGVLNTVLNPTALLSGAIEMPLLGWARQAEITADRAGLLAVGNPEVARRVLMSWSLKSSHLYQQLNMNAWVEQQSLEEDQTLRLSELLTTSTPYLGPRLKLLQQYANSPELKGYLRLIGDSIRQNLSPQQPPATTPVPQSGPATPPPNALPVATPSSRPTAATGAPASSGPESVTPQGLVNASTRPTTTPSPNGKKLAATVTTLKITCTACGAKMGVPAQAVLGVERRPVRCPNADCGAITALEKRIQPVSGLASPIQQQQQQLETMSDGD
jgi:Zn-dependent protease with chaperone function